MTSFQPWLRCAPGDVVDVIAPSGPIENAHIQHIQQFIELLGLKPRIPDDLLGAHPFCAHNDETRFKHLKNALYAEDGTLIWCVRGGHGVTRLMPELLKLSPPKKQKCLVGFSDITSLHLWLNQVWSWPSLHGPMARQVATHASDPRDVSALKQLWFEGFHHYAIFDLTAMNTPAKEATCITGATAGTCLSLIQTSIGTPWQLEAQGKILVLEDVNEKPYSLDRLLVHLSNAHILHQAKALIFGDFGEHLSTQEKAQFDLVLDAFANDWLKKHSAPLPVFRLQGFGHTTRNQPLPLGVPATLSRENTRWQLTFGAT